MSAVTATTLAKHLGLSRQRIVQLADEGVIQRSRAGFDQDACRLRYLNWLRDPARRAAKSEAASELEKAKARLVMLRVYEREGQLMETAEAIEIVTDLIGLLRTEISQLPALIGGRDMTERRRVDAICSAMLHRIAEKAKEAAKCDPGRPGMTDKEQQRR